MTDKERIIINGECIEKCPLLKKCIEFPKCKIREILKQLSSKTQECEELKKQLMRKDEINTFFNSPIEGWSSDPCGICKYKDEYSRYRKALEEIENFRNKHCVFWCERNRILDIINKAKGEGE